MAEFKTFRNYRRRRAKEYSSCCWGLSKRLNSIWSQNEQIISKLKDIEDFLNKFAEALAKQALKEENS